MYIRLWVSTAILTAGMIGISLPAMADVDWSGAGYYIYDLWNAFSGGFLAGPFSSESDCKAALAALSQDEQQGAVCTYYASNPDKS